MQEQTIQPEALSPEVQDVMRSLVSAFRTVKLYPPNNPVYSQSIKKSYEQLTHFLSANPEYPVGIQKTYFTYNHIPIGKDTQINKAIAQDLFTKGIREIMISAGVAEEELLVLCRAFALSPEELAVRNGISSILWEKGAEHIKVMEAGLDEVITTKTGRADQSALSPEELAAAAKKKESVFSGRSLVLGDLIGDPSGFAYSMLDLAKRTRAEHESVEDRLYTLYQEAGKQIEVEHAGEADAMFEGLAKSAIALEPNFREALIAGRLYKDLDTEMAYGQDPEAELLPSSLHEMQAGRYSKAWTAQQVSTLLRKSSARTTEQPKPQTPQNPADLKAVPLSGELLGIAKELGAYDADEMAALQILSQAGSEADVFDAAIRTYISLLPHIRNPRHAAPLESEFSHFSNIVRQLEEMLSYLLKEKDYQRAKMIIQVFHAPVEPAFRARMAEALKKTASKPFLIAAINELRKSAKGSPEYQSAYVYLSALERETTQVLLELLADEKDRNLRIHYLELVKDFGKNQMALLGECLSDRRWYFVRNIVNILGENKSDQAITFLRKAADHENVRIRQEVIKGLLSIGGKKAANVIAKFLRDRDSGVQVLAIRALGDFEGLGSDEVAPLQLFLESHPFTKKDRELILEAIKTLGKIGGRDAADLLKGYTRVRWWKSRALQVERRNAALQAIEEISRRKADGGQAKR